MLKVVLLGLFGLSSLLYQPAPDANAAITSPVTSEVLLGSVIVRGSANLPNQTVYYLEAQALANNLAPPDPLGVWLPVTLPSEALVLESVLGVWNTAVLADGFYALRLTVLVNAAQPVQIIASPLLVVNNRSFQARPTLVPADAYAGASTAVALANVNLRRGNDLAYGVTGVLRQGESVRVMGKGGGWFYVQPPVGGPGWLPADTVAFDGSFANVPDQAAPPLPANPLLPPAFPPRQANLIVSSARLLTDQPRCNAPYQVLITVTNIGDGPTQTGSIIGISDQRAADGSLLASSGGAFPVLGAGQSWTTTTQLTVNAYYAEAHRVLIQLDTFDNIRESSKRDNEYMLEYTLDKANCP